MTLAINCKSRPVAVEKSYIPAAVERSNLQEGFTSAIGVGTGIKNVILGSAELGGELISFLQPNLETNWVTLVAQNKAWKDKITCNPQSVYNMRNLQRNPRTPRRIQPFQAKRFTWFC
jgi:hypothetical protein